MSGRALGISAEAEAYRYIVSIGMRPLCKNYRKTVGEIDLIAQDGDTLVFIEVKARTTVLRGSPAEAVTISKQRKIVKTALMYLKENRLSDVRMRFDVISIDGGRLRHIRSAFDATGLF